MRFTKFGIILAVCSFSTFSWAGDKCFTMKPLAVINDHTCAPVKTHIQINDCTTGFPETDFEATARFECHKTPKQLKYWYQDSMLIGDLQNNHGTYVVVTTYSEDYGKKKPPVVAALPVPTLPDVTVPGTPSLNATLVSKEATDSTPAEPYPGHNVWSFGKTKISGLVDGYYAYNFNQPAPLPTPGASTHAITQNTYVSPTFFHDQMSLSLAKVVVSQDPEPVGYHVDLGFGPLADEVAFDAGNGPSSSTRNVLQAYASYKTPFGLRFDFGKFYTHMGFEVLETPENWNYTYTYLFNYAIPVWHTGLRAQMPIGDYASFTAMVANGWNNMSDNNRSKTWGGQLQFTPHFLGFEAVINYISGNETPSPGPTDGRTVYEGIAKIEPFHWIKLATDYVYASDKSDEIANSGEWKLTSTAFYGMLTVADWCLSFRQEVFTDGYARFGPSFGAANPIIANAGGQVINSSTVTLGYHVSESLLLRLEGRQDVSQLQPFIDREGQLANMQNIGILSAAASF